MRSAPASTTDRARCAASRVAWSCTAMIAATSARSRVRDSSTSVSSARSPSESLWYSEAKPGNITLLTPVPST